MQHQFFTNIFSAGRKYMTAILVLISTSSFAASPENVDAKIAADFANAFKNAANISWNVTNLYSEASFDWMNKTMHAFYDSEGNFYCLSKDIDMDELPVNAVKNIQQKYPGSVATQAIECTSADNTEEYFVLLENAKASLILKISEDGDISVFKKTMK